ncbi:MAG: flagellar hook-length control protein FliK [Armatimonadota bacterium]|nr:flagellar hook-length control protein FliK [bacterium]
MVDSISSIAPQSAEMVAQGSDSAAQDGSQFADVLSATFHDGQQTQAQDAQIQVEECTVEQVAPEMQVSDQTDGTDAQSAAEGLAAQMMAVVNAQVTAMVVGQTVKTDSDGVNVDVLADSMVEASVLSDGSAFAQSIQTSVAAKVETGGESLQAQTWNPTLFSADTAAQDGGQFGQSQTGSSTTASVLGIKSGSEMIASAAVANDLNEVSLNNDDDIVAYWQNLTKSITKSEQNDSNPVVTDAEDQPVEAQAAAVRQMGKNAEVVSPMQSGVRVQNTNVANNQAQAVEAAKNAVMREALNSNAGRKASVFGNQTKIEVSVGTETAREFTIKPQVINPVMSRMATVEGLTSGAVSKVASTENGSANLNTSSDGQTSAFAGQTFFDSAVKQTTATVQAQNAPRADQSLQQRVIDQIVQEVRMIKLPQRTDLVVRLTPPELGTLRVQISQAEQGMTAQIQTSGEQVRGLLQANLPALHQALSDAGLKMDSVSVTSGTSFGSLMQDDTTRDGAQQQFAGRRHNRSGYQAAMGVETIPNISLGQTAGAEGYGYSWLA